MHAKTYIFGLTIASIVALSTLVFIMYMTAQGVDVNERFYSILWSCLLFLFGLHMPNGQSKDVQPIAPATVPEIPA